MNDALKRGGAVVLRLYTDEWHYVLLTGIVVINMYSLGPYDGREAVIFFNEKTRLTEEETIEYFI